MAQPGRSSMSPVSFYYSFVLDPRNTLECLKAESKEVTSVYAETLHDTVGNTHFAMINLPVSFKSDIF